MSPRLDGWLVGGIGIVAWVVLARPLGMPGLAVPAVGGVLLWLLLAISGTHFGVSYHLAYGQGRAAIRRRPGLLIGVPALLGIAGAGILAAALLGAEGVARGGIRVLLVSVFTLTGWHYVKQVYGVARLGAAMRGISISGRAATVLRYGLYPLWFVDAAAVWTAGYRPADYGFEAGINILPVLTHSVVRVVALGAFVVIAGCFAGVALRARRMPPATMWTPYAAGLVWFMWPPDYVSTALVLGALHALQYLACAHRAEAVWGVERGEPDRTRWFVSVFGGALATGMLLSYWLPSWLSEAFGATTLGLVPAALLFAFFNLHHYAVDAAIWRSGDGHVRRIVRGPADAATLPSGAAISRSAAPSSA